jgi:hypothetical protein
MNRLFPVCCLILMFVVCSRHTASVTETDTGRITGWVVDGDKQGVAGAVVVVRSDETDSPVSAAKKAVAGSRVTDSATTSADGFFAFESVEAGDYYVEVNYRDSLGSIVGVTLKNDTQSGTTDTIMVKPLGALEGSIPRNLMNSDSTFIYIIELDRRIAPDSQGYFLIGSIPAFTYTVRIVGSADVGPSHLDIVVIEEQDTTRVFNIGAETGTITIDGAIEE